MVDTIERATILVIEDEDNLRESVCEYLELVDFAALPAHNGTVGLNEIREHNPDLVLLDLGLPDIDGLELLNTVRDFSNVPIIILTARSQEEDKVSGLSAGADDYLTKPFGINELEARIRAVLRRARQAAPKDGDAEISIGIEIDFARREVSVDGSAIHLTPTEFRLLNIFTEYPNEVLSHRFLLRQVWGGDYEEDIHILRATIWRLRQKIEADPHNPEYIVSKPGIGYRLKKPS